MRRRGFIAGLGAAAAWPVVARAQQAAMPVIGYLSSASPDNLSDRIRAYFQGLSSTGFEVGRNVLVEYRWARGQYAALPTFATELVQRKVNVIAAIGGSAQALAAKAATSTIPVVFQVGADPTELGLVASLARPGGNITGVTSLNADVGPKRLELMHELLPLAKVIALLVNPTTIRGSLEALTKEVQAAARPLGIELQVLHANDQSSLDDTLANLVQQQVHGLVIAQDILFTNRNQQLAAFSLRHSLPMISAYREFPAAGGLMSYGGDITESWRRAGVYTGRVLKGEKPADLPIQQSTKLEFVINLTTAKTLGLTIPPTLLGRADEVIE